MGFASALFFFHPVVLLRSGELCRAVAELQPQPRKSSLRDHVDPAGAAAQSAALPGCPVEMYVARLITCEL